MSMGSSRTTGAKVGASVASREDTGAVQPRARPRLAVRRIVKAALLAAVLVAAGIFGWRYWRHAQLYVSTDDAYVNADVVQIAAQVSGPVIRLDVRDQQHVDAGDLLFEIDPRPFKLALEAARAELDLAEQSVAEQSSAVAAARAALAQREAELRNAEANDERVRNLRKQGLVSAQEAEAAHTQALTAAAAVRAAKANLEQAINALGEAGAHNATILAAKAKLGQAKLDLEHTRVTAPTSGTIANLTLRPGATVQAQTPLFAIVSDRNFWVDANFKETQIRRIQPGQSAIVRVDMYPDRPFRGEVVSLSAGSGTAFSLLPPQNATGNWVKVTQRVPVRVHIIDPDPKYPLRIGTSARVEVRTG
ncbi:MAG TPA: HlyD family secretion protein [Gammaproteobacteria bacterium]|nr:HlyD family secretion protein [Gammaproteobacteria bacterium]